jgi:hypothetical protein
MNDKPRNDEPNRRAEMRIKRIRREINVELRSKTRSKLVIRPGDSAALVAAKKEMQRRERAWAAMSPEQRSVEWQITRARQDLTMPGYRAWFHAGMPCRARPKD